MVKKSDIISYSYKGFRTVASALYYLRFDMENAETFEQSRKFIPKHCQVDAVFFREYKRRWLPWSSSLFLSRRELEVYCHMGNCKSLDYTPWNVWYTTVDPMLNNKEMAWAYAEKGNYRKLYGVDNEPLSFFRFLNGLSYDAFGSLIQEPESFFEKELAGQTKILVKPVIDSWGGKNVLVFERNSKGGWQGVNEQMELSLKQLIAYYQKNFVVQEFMDPHPFYKRFNLTSFNTIRVYVYRSPKDEQVHILHTVLKAGGKGNVVDNIGAGGHAYYILEDGKFLYGRSPELKIIEEVPDGSGQLLKDLPEVPGIDEIKALAAKIALQTPFHRLLAMDMNIDSTGKPRLIELNLSEAGSGVQLFGVPFLGAFTDEIIEYCKSNKKTDYLKI
jgi:hypothetical protein